MYKLSKYFVASEPIIKNKYRLLYSTNSTAFLLVKTNEYQLLLDKNFDKLHKPTLKKLTDSKIIISEDCDELKGIIQENKKAISEDNVL